MSCGSRPATRAAASSIASGSPSTRRQISAKSGRHARCRGPPARAHRRALGTIEPRCSPRPLRGSRPNQPPRAGQGDRSPRYRSTMALDSSRALEDGAVTRHCRLHHDALATASASGLTPRCFRHAARGVLICPGPARRAACPTAGTRPPSLGPCRKRSRRHGPLSSRTFV